MTAHHEEVRDLALQQPIQRRLPVEGHGGVGVAQP
jgi:hypothetical protein